MLGFLGRNVVSRARPRHQRSGYGHWCCLSSRAASVLAAALPGPLRSTEEEERCCWEWEKSVWEQSTDNVTETNLHSIRLMFLLTNGNCYTDLKCTARVNAWCIIHKCSIADYVFLFSYSSFLFQAKNKQTAVYFGGLGYSPCNYNLTYLLDLRETLQDFPWLPINHLLSIIHLQILFWQMLHIANTRALL